MPSTAVAEAATSSSAERTPSPVKERSRLWNHGTIRIKVPDYAKWGTFEDTTTKLRFLQFAPFIKGGRVNIFVHNATDAMIGKWIVASAELWNKTLEDGRSYLYIDLYPSPGSKDPTHRMFVMSGASNHPSAFNAAAPLKGFVLFASPDAKIDEISGSIRKPCEHDSDNKK